MPVNTIINEVSKRLEEGKKLFAVFDRDGTLAPIVDDPNSSFIEPDLHEALDALAAQRQLITGILSARSVTELRKDFPEQKHILAGNYGLEISVPGLISFTHPVAESSRVLLRQAKQELKQLMLSEYKTILEDHGLSLCLHWHRSPVIYREKINSLLAELASTSVGLNFKTLPSSYEIWPAVDWDKASGLRQMLQLAQASHSQVFFLYCGDSAPDEPAFDWVNLHDGISVHIGENNCSSANYTLESPAHLYEFICQLSRLLSASSARHLNKRRNC